MSASTGAVLVTGASGYLASALVARLRGEAGRIVRLSRGRLPAPPPGAATVEDVCGDPRDRKTWDALPDGIKTVFHLAAQTSAYAADRDPRADWEANVLPMLHLTEWCRARGHRPAVLFAGAATEVGMPEASSIGDSLPDAPVTVYDLHKLAAEQYLGFAVRQGWARGATLRLCNVYGPGAASRSADRGVLNAMVHKALTGEPPTVYASLAGRTRDYVYIDDVTDAFLRAAHAASELGGRHFLVGSGRGATVSEAFRLAASAASALTGRAVEVRVVPDPDGLLPIEHRDAVADVRAFTDATGWRPHTALAEGLRLTAEAFRKEGLTGAPS